MRLPVGWGAGATTVVRFGVLFSETRWTLAKRERPMDRNFLRSDTRSEAQSRDAESQGPMTNVLSEDIQWAYPPRAM